jgi:hypothetical protein
MDGLPLRRSGAGLDYDWATRPTRLRWFPETDDLSKHKILFSQPEEKLAPFFLLKGKIWAVTTPPAF